MFDIPNLRQRGLTYYIVYLLLPVANLANISGYEVGIEGFRFHSVSPLAISLSSSQCEEKADWKKEQYFTFLSNIEIEQYECSLR